MAEKPKDQQEEQKAKVTCGIVMPIADFAPYPTGHWQDVKEIIDEAVRSCGYRPRIVSTDDSVGVIQHRIVSNLYENEIVVVDASGRNPNVMFELGMRLAFDKPVVIIKDEITSYNFDTSPIEHIPYRSDLHYQSTNAFKLILSDKIKSTYESSLQSGFSPFLKHFGNISASKLEQRDGSEFSVLLSEIAELRREFRANRSANKIKPNLWESSSHGFLSTSHGGTRFGAVIPDISESNADSLSREILSLNDGRPVDTNKHSEGTLISYRDASPLDIERVKARILSQYPKARFMVV